jgi:hypothetical protein
VSVRLEDPIKGDGERDMLAELMESISTVAWCSSRRRTTASLPPLGESFAAVHRALSSASPLPSSSERVGPGATEVLRLPVAAEVLGALPLAFPFAGARLRFAPAATGMVWQEYRQQVRPRAWVLAYSASRLWSQRLTGLYPGISSPEGHTSTSTCTGGSHRVHDQSGLFRNSRPPILSDRKEQGAGPTSPRPGWHKDVPRGCEVWMFVSQKIHHPIGSPRNVVG